MVTSVANDGTLLFLPQLKKFGIISLHGDHVPIESGGNLDGSVNEKISVELIAAAHAEDGQSLDPKPTTCRLKVCIEFDGVWTSPKSSDPVIRLCCRYEGRFSFKEPMDPVQLDSLLGNSWYRITIVSQVYPLAQKHFIDQLSLMSLNVKRPIGFNPEIINAQLKVSDKPIAKKRRSPRVKAK